MNETIVAIANRIKSARLDKNLTQQEVGDRVGLPQSHVSKIEQGRVDLQLSSLIELARALDLEIALVPRKSLPAVESAVRVTEVSIGERNVRSDLALYAQIARDVTQRLPQFEELTGFPRAIGELQKALVPAAYLEELQKALKPASDGWALFQRPVQQSDTTFKVLEYFSRSAKALKALRNSVVHRQEDRPVRAIRAYQLDDDE